jgi:glycosyltransferase involved in cell wall biosynthesis
MEGNVAARAVVVLQSGLYRSGSTYWMKEVLYEYFAERLCGLFDAILLAAPVTTSDEDRFQHARVEAAGVHVLELQSRLSGGLRLVRAIRGADFVWVFLPSLKGLFAGLACIVLRVPYAVYYGGDIKLTGGRFPTVLKNAAFRLVLRKAGAGIAAGGELVASARRYLPSTEPTVPAISIRPEHLDETEARGPQSPGAVFRWIYVGNTHPWKRPDVLLRAFALWSRCAGVPGELHFVGPGPQDALRASSEELGVAPAVHWHGYVPNGEGLYDLYRQADVFVLASEFEGFPRVLYEAMAFGVPIVTTPVSGVPYLLHDEAECLMVPMGDPQAMAAAVSRLQTDRPLRERLARNALTVVRPIVEADGSEQVRRAVLRALAESAC